MRVSLFFFQAEDGIRDLVRSRGLGDVYKRQQLDDDCGNDQLGIFQFQFLDAKINGNQHHCLHTLSLIHILTLPTSDLV